MRANQRRLLAAAGFIGACVLSCNLPKAMATPNASGTSPAATLSALETDEAITQAAAYTSSASTPLRPGTVPPTPAPSLDAVLLQDTLCWVGPGNQYEVVSAIRTGIRVQLVGRASIPGWYIVRNPIYNDPCWIPSDDLQVDPNTNIAGLPVFSPPATPTPTFTKTPKPTASPINTPLPSATPSPRGTP